jgi:hypothetical protein
LEPELKLLQYRDLPERSGIEYFNMIREPILDISIPELDLNILKGQSYENVCEIIALNDGLDPN